MLNALSEAAVFLVVSANDRPGAAERLRDVASDINGLVRAVGFRQSAKAMGSGPLSCVVGFGSCLLGPDPASRLSETRWAAPVPAADRCSP